MPSVRPLFLVALVLTSCGGSAVATDPAPRTISAADLDELVLAPHEAPPGTEYLAASSGPLTVKKLWNPACCPGQIAAFEEAGFTTGYRSMFQRPGHSGDPIDARPGVEVAASTAAMFTDTAGADRAMREWHEFYDSPVLDPLGTDGLGEDAIAVMGSPNAPAEVVFLYLWRIDEVVLSLRVSGGRGTVGLDRVRGMVDRMARRAS